MPEDVTHLLEGEGQQQEQGQEGQEAQAQPEEELIPFKYRGEERQIVASALDGLAGQLGTTRDNALMWLQMGKDYGQHMGEFKQRERALAQREAELNAYYQQLEAQRAQPQPTQAHQQPDPEDPIALIRAIHEGQKAFERNWQLREEQFSQMLQQERQEREASAFREAYDGWASSKKSRGFKDIPTQEELLQEAYDMGMGYARHLTPAQVFEKAFRSLRFEDAAQMGQQQYQEKLRNPRAQVVVPGGGGPAPQPKPAQEGTLESLGDMKWGEMIQNLPETRR